MKVSVILPTRQRFESLHLSVRSLLDRLAGSEIEFLLGLDEDDQETTERLKVRPVPFSTIWITPRLGYRNLHVYVNQLSARATGDWLFLWNDDALMETEAWDDEVARFEGELVVVNPQSNHGNHQLGNCIFPIVPKRMFDLLGHFSLSNHNDTYVEYIANYLGIRRDVPIYVNHDRADFTGANNDAVYAEREFTTAEFAGPENQGHIRRDIEILQPYVGTTVVGR